MRMMMRSFNPGPAWAEALANLELTCAASFNRPVDKSTFHHRYIF
jgi:hypothetical protein